MIISVYINDYDDDDVKIKSPASYIPFLPLPLLGPQVDDNDKHTQRQETKFRKRKKKLKLQKKCELVK